VDLVPVDQLVQVDRVPGQLAIAQIVAVSVVLVQVALQVQHQVALQVRQVLVRVDVQALELAVVEMLLVLLASQAAAHQRVASQSALSVKSSTT